MAGIYLHIPFCSKACHYCDFHFSTVFTHRESMVKSIANELELKKTWLANQQINTIYFGGGTPSVLAVSDIERLLKQIHLNFEVNKTAEITLEANPDDLSLQKLKDLKDIGINRLSIGIQSFFDEHLKFFNRSHTMQQSFKVLENVHQAGFSNFSIDLIYGFDQLTLPQLQSNLKQIEKFKIPHVSAYALTVEPKTVLDHQVKKGLVKNPSQQLAANHYNEVKTYLIQQGLQHYEVSNFGRLQFISKHNTAYWQQKNYLGVGPSAHSFNGNERSWNVANNIQYIQKVQNNERFWETESLTEENKFNELMMLGLRTIWGISKSELQQFSTQVRQKFVNDVQPYLHNHKIIESDYAYTLHPDFWFLAEGIAVDLMQVETS